MTLASALPVSVSLSAEPIRFSMPVSVSLPAATVFWAVPCTLRSTVTPVVDPAVNALTNDAVSLPLPPFRISLAIVPCRTSLPSPPSATRLLVLLAVTVVVTTAAFWSDTFSW